MEQYKTCSKCKQIKSSSEYYPDKRSPTGCQPQCRDCVVAWRKENKDRIYEQKQKYRSKPESKLKESEYAKLYQKNNPERTKANRIRYQENNRERRKLQNAEWAAANKERISNNRRRNVQKKPEQYRAYSFQRRARLKAASNFLITKKELKKLYLSNCFYCQGQGGTIDHVIPLSRGGNHSIGNLVACCKSCNSRKRDRTITEWLYKR